EEGSPAAAGRQGAAGSPGEGEASREASEAHSRRLPRLLSRRSSGAASPSAARVKTPDSGRRSTASRVCHRSASREAELDGDPVLTAADPELMRGMPAGFALRSRRLWGASAGGEETFALSRPVMVIDAFLSHEWMTPGWLKMAGLAFYLNTPRAVAAAVLVHAVLHALELAGAYTFPIPPVHGDTRTRGDVRRKRGGPKHASADALRPADAGVLPRPPVRAGAPVGDALLLPGQDLHTPD
ncbi:unnamed protein product, partial [Prorocentrum cordatum]